MISETVDTLLLQQLPDAVIFADVEGVICLWNESATRVFGHSQQQALGASLDIIVPERLRVAHWRGYQRALADRQTKYAGQALPTRSMRADGVTIYVELSFSVVVDASGGVLGALSVARDITTRFEKEKSDRKLLAELGERLNKED